MFKYTYSIVLFFALTGTATAQTTYRSESLGTLNVTGFVTLQADIRTGDKNTNPSTVFDSNIQQVKQWGLLDFVWDTPISGIEVFLRARYQWDLTDAIVDGEFDAFPGVGGNVDITRTGGRDAIVELWEARIDYNNGPWWFRLGRQNIVWGDLSPTRLLDTFNPLDLSFHVFNEFGGRAAFDNIRIPKWALRGSYTFPFNPNYSLEAFVSPNEISFIPTQLPDPASPFDLVPVPGFVQTVNSEEAQTGVSGGVRLLGSFRNVGFSLVWMYRPESDTGIQEFVSFTPPATVGGPPSIVLRNINPDYHTLGFSTNYFHAPSKVVVRTEFMYNINRPFNRLGAPVPTGISPRHIEVDEIGYAIAFDRPTFLLRKSRAMRISVSFEQRFRPVGGDDLGPGESLGLRGATQIDKTETIFRVLLGQAWPGFGGRYDEIITDLTFFYDLGDSDSSFIQPAIRYEPGNHWRMALWYTGWNGGDRRSGKFGSLKFASGVGMSLTYQF